MSKYLYTTVYEQFTGMKPPEPKKEEKSERRRGLGHPYRMRLQQQGKKNNAGSGKAQAKRSRNPYRLRQNQNEQQTQPQYHHKAQADSQTAPYHHANNAQTAPLMAEARSERLYELKPRQNKPITKVTYKKRRLQISQDELAQASA